MRVINRPNNMQQTIQFYDWSNYLSKNTSKAIEQVALDQTWLRNVAPYDIQWKRIYRVYIIRHSF